MNQATGGMKDRRPEQARPEKARRLAALERAQALGERIRAAEDANKLARPYPHAQVPGS